MRLGNYKRGVMKKLGKQNPQDNGESLFQDYLYTEYVSSKNIDI